MSHLNRNDVIIGVDARPLSGPINGIGRYTYEILSRITKMGHKWTLFSHKPLNSNISFEANVRVITQNLNSRLSRMVWAQTMLPYLSHRYDNNLFWSPAHRLPELLSERISKVVTIHDFVWNKVPSSMRKASKFLDSILMPRAIRSADSIIVVSNSTKSDLIDFIPLMGDKISVIHLGNTIFQENIFNLTEPKYEILEENYILFVGTFEPRKNIEKLIDAFSQISSNILKDTLLVIVGGDGWGGVNPEKLAIKFKISERVRVFGCVDDFFLEKLYSRALFLALPSLYEGFGLPLIEAMKYGVPCLTSNISSMPEVVGNGGLLIEPNSVASIKSGLEKLLGDDHLRSNLGASAKIQSLKFQWDSAAKKTFDLIERLIYEK